MEKQNTKFGEHLSLKIDHGIATVRIEREQKRNALDIHMLKEISRLFRELDDHNEIRSVILAGSEKAFSAGADIGKYDEQTLKKFLDYQRSFQKMCASIEQTIKPVVAAVRGYALGGGFILMNSCDLIVIAEDAKVGLPEIKIGMFGGGPRVIEYASKHQAMELMMLGEIMNGREAVERGFANRVVTSSDVEKKALEIAEELAQRPPAAIAACKRFINEGNEASKDVNLHIEMATLGYLFSTKDAKEGIRAFIEKRPAKFTGE